MAGSACRSSTAFFGIEIVGRVQIDRDPPRPPLPALPVPLDDALGQLPCHPVQGAPAHTVLESRQRRLRRQALAGDRVPPQQQLVDGIFGEVVGIVPVRMAARDAEARCKARETCPPAVTGNPCASRMIPLESPVPEIGTPGSESGGRKRTHGSRPAARRESAGQATNPLPATRLPSTLLNAVKMHRPSRSLSLAHGAPPRPGILCGWAVLISTAYGHKRKGNQPMPTPSFAIP